MGLDMHLYRRSGAMSWDLDDPVYLSDETLYDGDLHGTSYTLKPQYQAMKDQLDAWYGSGSLGPQPPKYYQKPDVSEVGYWRKANQIHGWFVQHCQEGIDECQFTPVHHEQLKGLYDLCLDIAGRYAAAGEFTDELEAFIMEELPPTGGFFFGGYGIDDYYFRDIQNTIEILEPLLSNPPTPSNPYCLGYSSSW
jgi:hypothetical protein